MKNDDLVRSKIESLSPLSGGIVFGKEEAWEKLQGRMDRKPSGNLKPLYWMAAAALIPLIIFIASLGKQTAETFTRASPWNVHFEGKKTIASAPLVQGNVSQPAAVQKEHRRLQGNNVPAIAKDTQLLTVQPPVENKIIDTPALVKNRTPARVNKSMTVVSVYDLGDSDGLRTATQIPASTPSKADLAHFKVVHMRDVINEDGDLRTLTGGSRLTIMPLFQNYLDKTMIPASGDASILLNSKINLNGHEKPSPADIDDIRIAY